MNRARFPNPAEEREHRALDRIESELELCERIRRGGDALDAHVAGIVGQLRPAELDLLQKRFRIERAFIPSRGADLQKSAEVRATIRRVCGRCLRARVDVAERRGGAMLCDRCAEGVSGDPPKH